MFGATKVNRYEDASETGVEMVVTFWSGMVWGAVARKYGLHASILGHALSNALPVIGKQIKKAASNNLLQELGMLLELGITFLSLYRSILPRLVQTNRYSVIIQHSERFMPRPPPEPVVDTDAAETPDVFHDAVDEVLDREMENFYDALTMRNGEMDEMGLQLAGLVS